MCEFCTKHGEGKKWYLEVKNYSNDLLSDVKRRKFTKDFFYWTNETYKNKFNLLKAIPFKKFPIVGNVFQFIIKKWLLYTHWGQVVPIEDVEKILSITNSITRVPCICRMSTTGKECRTCFLISLDPQQAGIAETVDHSFFKGPDLAKLERVDKKTALNFMKESEAKGMIHTIWTFKAPFTGGLCSCDLSSGCIPMKMYDQVAPIFFRAEYIAQLDAESCIGCGECIKICQFDAIELDKKNKKVKIDIKKCYGCGICRSICKKNAINLIDRNSINEVSKLW